jgi:tripeptidyl-peptidase I
MNHLFQCMLILIKPRSDPSYPDAYSGGTKACGTITPASVISTSYGYNEADLSPAYATRQCNEYMKLGLQGITILYSSGDNGVAGNGNVCCVSKNCASEGYTAAGSRRNVQPFIPKHMPIHHFCGSNTYRGWKSGHSSRTGVHECDL